MEGVKIYLKKDLYHTNSDVILLLHSCHPRFIYALSSHLAYDEVTVKLVMVNKENGYNSKNLS